MEEIFVTQLRINKVRHLENLVIPLSETERKHLILTGKNGSGKTSVLFEMKNYFLALFQDWFIKRDNPSFWDIYRIYQSQISNLKNSLFQLQANYNNVSSNPYWQDDTQIQIQQRLLKTLENEFDFMIFLSNQLLGEKSNLNLLIDIINENKIKENYESNQFIVSFFESKRSNFVGIPVGSTKLTPKPLYNLRERANINFNQFIVNLKTRSSFAYEAGEKEVYESINNWFIRFNNLLKYFFNDSNLELKFDPDEYNFYINIDNKQPFDLNNLSDGYSALFSIITEIMMRMENKNPRLYDIQGIVLIDEIETHLHIDLQKKILPFLTSFFPKIQFIVTTHSPFVLSSIDNAVIYDLEKQERVEDLSAYSYTNIVKGYFGTDEYSDEIKEKIAAYENLINKMQGTTANLSVEEKGQFYELKKYFEELPKSLSPELQLKIQQLELSQLTQ